MLASLTTTVDLLEAAANPWMELRMTNGPPPVTPANFPVPPVNVKSPPHPTR